MNNHRPTFTCSVCGNTFRFYGQGDPAPDQTCLGCNPWYGNPANRTAKQNAKRAQLRDHTLAQSATVEQAAPLSEEKRDEFLEWSRQISDQTPDYIAEMMAIYGAEIEDSPCDWRDMRGDLAF